MGKEPSGSFRKEGIHRTPWKEILEVAFACFKPAPLWLAFCLSFPGKGDMRKGEAVCMGILQSF